MDLGLTDKVAIVTGSSRGLGLASARALVAEGCRVCLCARGDERLAEAALEVEAAAKRPNMVATVQADVSTEAGIELVIEQAVETFGGLDILVNNVGRAGGSRPARTPPTPSGRRRSTRRCFRRSAPRAWPCRT